MFGYGEMINFSLIIINYFFPTVRAIRIVDGIDRAYRCIKILLAFLVSDVAAEFNQLKTYNMSLILILE